MAKPASEIWRDYVTDGVPASGPNNPVKRDVREWSEEVEENIASLGDDIADGVARDDTQDARLDAVEAGAGGGLIVKVTWAALSATTGSFDGQAAEVPATDAGTHTDPVVGGTVPNAGRYSWSVSPAGWRWISADTLAGKADKTITITGAGLATGGGNLSANRVITVAKATPAEVVTGTDDTKAVTPLGVGTAVSTGFGTQSEKISLYNLIERRKWPSVPSLSALAIPDVAGPFSMTFARALAAYRVNSRGYLELIPSGTIRHDFHPTTSIYRGWLMEPAVTNRLRNSNVFTATGANGWAKSNSTTTAGASQGPDDLLSATMLAESATTANHSIAQTTTTSPNTLRTWSIWVKSNGRRYVRLLLDDPGDATNFLRASYDLVTGEVMGTTTGGNASGVTARIVTFPSGWYRLSISGIHNTSGTETRAFLFLATNGDVTGSASYAGNGVSGVYLFGAQLEDGPEATSYIPTTTEAVLRPADILTAPVGSWFNPARGAIYLDFETPVTTALSDVNTLASFDDETNNEALRVTVSSDVAKFRVVDGGALVAEVTAGGLDQTEPNRFVGLWETDNIGASINAGAVPLDTSASLPTVTRLRVSPERRAHFRHIAVFPRRLSDSDARIISMQDIEGKIDDDERLELWATKDDFVLAEFRASDGSFRFVGQTDVPKIPEVVNVWSGGVTPTSIGYTYDILHGAENMEVRERVTTDADGINVVASGSIGAPVVRSSLYPEPYYTRSGEFTGLTPNTEYFIWSEFGGSTHNVCRFRTLPATGTPSPLKFICSSCQRPKTQREYSSTYVDMLDEDALLHVQLGDYHYANIAVDDLRYWRRAIRFMLGHQNMQPFHRICPVAYMPDDHDTGPNNFQLNKTYPGVSSRQIVLNMQTVLDEYPHYPLVHPGTSFPAPDTVMTQEWPSAHIWNILVDSRSQREYRDPHEPVGTPDMAGTILGDGTKPVGSWDQVTGLKNMLLAAGAAGYYAVNLWFPVMWHKLPNGNPIPESWWSCAGQEVIDFQEWLRDTPGIPQVYLLVGDNHNKGADDGRKTDLTPGGGLQVPQFLCSASHHRSRAGFPDMRWNSGTLEVYHNDRGYGLIELDAAGHITVTMKGAPVLGDGVYDLTAPMQVLGTYSSKDVTPAVQFAQTSINAPPSSTIDLPITKSWFGPPGPVNATALAARYRWDFLTTTESWTGSNATLSASGGALTASLTSTTGQISSPSGRTIRGSVFTKVRVRIRRTAGTNSWIPRLRYVTAGHGIDNLFRKDLAARTTDADFVTLEFDMADLTAGGTDWIDSTITQINLQFAGAVIGSVFHIDWVEVGAPGGPVVLYSTDQGTPQIGAVQIRPNSGKYVLTLNTPASGSFIVTLSQQTVGMDIGGNASITVNVV